MNNYSLSSELQSQVEHLYFIKALKKKQIYEKISLDRHIDAEEVKKHIKNFNVPKFFKIADFQTLFLDIRAASPKYPIIKASNRYLKFDGQNGIVSFSFATNQIKNRYSDLLLFDATTCTKFTD